MLATFRQAGRYPSMFVSSRCISRVCSATIFLGSRASRSSSRTSSVFAARDASPASRHLPATIILRSFYSISPEHTPTGHISAMQSPPRRPSSTVRIFLQYCLRVVLRIPFTTRSARVFGCFALAFVPYNHCDETKTLTYSMQPIWLLKADGGL